MKSSSSRSQLLPKKSKNMTTDSSSNLMVPTHRRKSQTSDNANKANKSRSHIQTKQEANKGEIDNVKSQEMFAIIETFYNTLCNLPMQMLMNSADPQFWLKEQEQTLKQLQRKLEKAKRHKEYEYYHWKLQSVAKLLENIAQNIGMLQRITHLKGYYSGTDTSNYRSRGTSSIESERCQAKVQNSINGGTTDRNNEEMISYDRYEIKQSHKKGQKSYKTKSPEIMAETVQSDEEMSDDEPTPVMRSEVFQTTRNQRKREVSRDGQNRDTSNIDRGQFLKQKSKELESKDKTLTKVPFQKMTNTQRTLSNYAISDRFLEDRLMTGTQQDSIQQERCLNTDLNTVDNSKQQISQVRQSFQRQNEKQEYLAMIKELRLELLTKDKEIQKLLINQQEYEEGIQIFKERQKEKQMEILFMQENVSKVNKEKEKLQIEIKRLHQYQDELKDTIRHERERNRKEQKQRNKIEQKYYEEATNKQELILQINQLKEENKTCRRNERVMKQKLQVYTKKYFKIYGELQQSKEIEKKLIEEMRDLQSKGVHNISKYDEIKELIEYQKQKLFDESF